MLDGAKLIENERLRQIGEEGWTAEHDNAHTDGALWKAAACYLLAADPEAPPTPGHVPLSWPWDGSWWKPASPVDPLKDLIRAGALIAAEIDRRIRRMPNALPPAGAPG